MVEPLIMADAKEPQHVELGDLSANEKSTDVHQERTQLLADLPNPDAGKSDEEQAEIVQLLSRTQFRPCAFANSDP